MADTQQWRREIQPARNRTHAPTPVAELDEADDMLSPPTPKLRLKPKLSSYFNQPSDPPPSTNDHAGLQLPKWSAGEVFPDPKPEEEMDAVMCHLMSNPFDNLDRQFNGSLMRIFESYTKLNEEKKELQQRLDTRTATCKAVASKFNMAMKDWEDEKQDYKDEVKRLEVLLAKAGKRGVAEVTLARQDSKLRSRNAGGLERKETIFEFLEKTKRIEDPSWINQRATMKPLFQSPSDQDRRISRHLTQKKSMTNIHADLPFGTPPTDMRFSLAEASLLEQQAAEVSSRDSSTTDESFSASSFLPDDDPTINAAELNNEAMRDAAESFASTLNRRRNVDTLHLTPQLENVHSFPSPPVERIGRASGKPNAFGISLAASKSTASSGAVPSNSTVKRSTVMTRASGFLQKLRPQLNMDTSPMAPRRFSFEPGDDFAAQISPTEGPSPPVIKTLRKSVSLYTLLEQPLATPMNRSLSPVAHSPTTSVPTSEGRPQSRIPTPVFNNWALARPRQEREDSSSSLLTVIQHPDEGMRRIDSRTSSVHSSPSVGRDTKAGASISYESSSAVGLKPSKSSNRLLDHTNSLRGSPSNLAVAAARAASLSNDVEPGRPPNWRRSSAHSSQSAPSNRSDASDHRLENSRPS